MVHIGVGNHLDSAAQNVEDEREVIVQQKHKHTSGLEVEVEPLTARVKAILTLANSVHQGYEQWRREVVDIRTVEDLLGRFPDSTYPQWAQEALDELDETRDAREEAGEDTLLPDHLRADIIQSYIPQAESKWDTYNDLTQAIWHNDNTSDATKQGRFDRLHRAMDPIAASQDG
jgi:hypothetical protein